VQEAGAREGEINAIFETLVDQVVGLRQIGPNHSVFPDPVKRFP